MSREEFRISHGNFRTLFDYKTVIEMFNDECEAEEISNHIEASPGMILRFLKEYLSYDEEISKNWVDIMHRLWELECDRGSIPKDDDVLKVLRSIFNEYIFDPTIPNKPTISDIDWNYEELVKRETIEKNQFIPIAIDGGEHSFDNPNRDWVEFFSNYRRNEIIKVSWNGSSVGGLVEWLDEFFFRGWKLYELKADLESDELKASFKQ